MTEADFIIAATAIAVVGVIIIGVHDFQRKQAQARTPRESLRIGHRKYPATTRPRANLGGRMRPPQ